MRLSASIFTHLFHPVSILFTNLPMPYPLLVLLREFCRTSCSQVSWVFGVLVCCHSMCFCSSLSLPVFGHIAATLRLPWQLILCSTAFYWPNSGPLVLLFRINIPLLDPRHLCVIVCIIFPLWYAALCVTWI